MQKQKKESGRSMLEIIAVIAIILLLVMGGIYGAKNIITNIKAQAVSKQMTNMVTQRRLNMSSIKNKTAERTEKAPYGIDLTIKNETEGSNAYYFVITSTFDSEELYQKVVDTNATGLRADKIEIDSDASINGSVTAKFYYKKYATSKITTGNE